MIGFMRYDAFVKLKVDDTLYAKPDPEGRPNTYGEAWDSPLSYYAGEVLDACGCGRPEDHVRYIRDALQMLANFVADERMDVRAVCADFSKHKAEFFHGDINAEQFMWYWLDHKGFTEHGSCIPGWLTEEGKALLEDLGKCLPPEVP